MLALALLSLAGCAAERDTHPKGLSAPAVNAYDEIGFPLSDYIFSIQEKTDLENAARLTVADCMRDRGYPVDWPARNPQGATWRLYGVIDIRDAKELGYQARLPEGMTGQDADAAEKNERDGLFAGWSAEKKLAYEGNAPEATGAPSAGATADASGGNGCRDTAAGFHPADGTGSDAAEALQGKVGQKVEEQRAAKDSTATWSSCMKAAGYDYKGPWDANDSPEWHGEQHPGERQKAVATADARCKLSSNWVGIRVALEKQYESDAIRDNLDKLKENKARDTKLLEQARAVIARH
ncbi:hypothetical protein ACIQOW_12470 [Kitasatospora sp. NPDC091335]|uniref:hypothetical protein n=1 Tax=Kitasatospora sp. NPDC091335 TaxID=3364085 RepID=UPI003830B214